MFSAASKVYFTVGGSAVVAGALFAVATGDRGGFTLLMIAGVVAVALAVAAFVFVAPDPVAVGGDGDEADAEEEAPAPPAASRPAGAGDPPRPSPWPVGVAASVGLMAIGAALGKGLILAGLLVGIIATFSWLGQVWREHPLWTREMTDRLNDRFIIPIGLPGTVVALVGVGVVSFSRLLLAVNKEVATFVALVAAVAILGGCAFVASRPRMGRSAIGALAAFSGVTLLAAGVAGAVKGEREFPHEGGEEGAVVLVAKDLAFEVEELDLPAGKVVVDFENHDPPGVQHNLAILPDGGGEALFRGPLVDGGGKARYEFDSPPPGKYTFQCDVHPQQMKGPVLVTPDSSSGEKPAAPPGAPTGK